jgi:DNA polymerase III delta prime subunit
MSIKHTIWAEAYRPNELEKYIGSEPLKDTIKQWIKSNDIPHLLLNGSPGTGKTTLAKLIANNINCVSLYINASDENGIDTIRDKVKSFASAASFTPLKIIILDEADYLTINAQASLRNIIETYSIKTRFILTCNYIERIIEPIQSRCKSYKIEPPSKGVVAEHVVKILDIHNIKYELKNIAIIINDNYPDIRKIINSLQYSSQNGQLDLNIKISSFDPTDIIELLKIKPTFNNIRQYISDNEISDFEPLYKSLYDNLDNYSKPNNHGFITMAIADHQFKHINVLDKEINFMSLISSILNINK